jgi:hypothetical protein
MWTAVRDIPVEKVMVFEDRKHCEYVIKFKSSISNDDTYLETIL